MSGSDAGLSLLQHAPVLQVVIPLVAAPICVLLRHPAVVRVFAVGVAWLCLADAAVLVAYAADATGEHLAGIANPTPLPWIYELGGWAPPAGISLNIDLASAYVCLIVATIAAVVMPFGLGQGALTVPRERWHLFYAAFLLCMSGLFGITVTGDAFNVFVFLEVTSLSSYSLISLGRGRQALRAAFSYLIMGTIGGTFILLGIGLAYQATGTLNMADLAALLPTVESRGVQAGFAFIFVGAAIKLAVFPLHQWLPNAYTYAPSVISAFLAATATKVSYYLLVRMIFGVFGGVLVFGLWKAHLVLLPLSLVAMFVGSLAALYQTDIKRLLAYSSIAQIGYMTLGLSMGNLRGLSGGLVHLFNHALMKGGLFLVVACVVYRLGSQQLEDMRGIGRRMPLTSAALVVGGLSLIGVPGTVGFISKWYLVLGALDQGWIVVAGAILLSSLLAVAYVWKIIEVFFFGEPAADSPAREVSWTMLVPTWFLIGGCVFFGLNTDLSVGLATHAAAQLLGVSP